VLYHWYDLSHIAMRPARVAADSCRHFFRNPFNPFSHTAMGRQTAAACEVFERTTRRYDKPVFGITSTRISGRDVSVTEDVVWQRPFCRLKHFKRGLPASRASYDPRILIVAPMSGHYATLLRGTVEALIPNHEVYITDWTDSRDVSLLEGSFDLDDYIIYLREMLRHLDGDVHVLAVCQSSVPALAALALIEEDDAPYRPSSLIMAGGPIDTRINPTIVNNVAKQRGTNWFRNNVISTIPWPNIGAGRAVYPGFLQLSGFMSMNLERHARAHKDLFLDLVRGDGDSAEKHREFYDEYLAVMDLTAEFYLQTIDSVFIRHLLPKNEFLHRGRLVDLKEIRSVPIMTIEGEKDDITGLGQCRAALNLCSRLADAKKYHLQCAGVGHYGIFNGSRFRAEIAPKIGAFIRANDSRVSFYPPQAEIVRHTASQAAAAHDISAVAFTFAAAND
jgi:poly(3-hydroxybutyrate) depolymerase